MPPTPLPPSRADPPLDANLETPLEPASNGTPHISTATRHKTWTDRERVDDIMRYIRQKHKMSVNQFVRAYATTINDRGGQNTATFRAHKLADTILEDDDILQLQNHKNLGRVGLFSVAQIRKEMVQLESVDGYFGAYKHRDNIEDMGFQMAIQQLERQAPCLLALLDALIIPRRVRQDQKEREPLSGRVALITAILCFSRGRSTSNNLQRTLGLYFYSMGVKRRVISVLHGLGVCESYRTINRENRAIAERAQEGTSYPQSIDHADALQGQSYGSGPAE